MNNAIKYMTLTLIIILPVMDTIASQPPPPPPSGHGQNGNQPPAGGAAPIGSGLTIFICMALLYATRKAYQANKKRPL